MNRRSFLGSTAATLTVACVDAPTGPTTSQPVTSPAGTTWSQGSMPRVLGADGTAIEVDTLGHLLIRYDPTGFEHAVSGGLGSELGSLNGPTVAAFAPDGEAWVLDRGNRRLQRFDANGAVVDVLDVENASAMAVSPDGALALAEASTRRIQVLDGQGVPLQSTALQHTPRDLAWAPDGSLVIVTLEGGVTRVVSGVATTVLSAGTLGAPSSVAVDAEGRIHLTDLADHTLRVFSAAGDLVDVVRPTLEDGRPAQPIRVSVTGTQAHLTVVPAVA